MLIGENELRLNEETVVAALQHYFDSVLFAEGKAPLVIGVSHDNSGYAPKPFHVKVGEPLVAPVESPS